MSGAESSRLMEKSERPRSEEPDFSGASYELICSGQRVHCGDAEVTTRLWIYLWRSFGVRQLAAALLQASLLAGTSLQTRAIARKLAHRFTEPSADREQARGRKAAASCRTPKLRRGVRADQPGPLVLQVKLAKRVRDVWKRRHGQRCDYTPSLRLNRSTARWRRVQAPESASTGCNRGG